MDTLAIKLCSSCGETRPVSEFNKRTRAADGLQARCRRCQSESKKTWRIANAQHVYAEHSRWMAEHPDYWPDYWLRSQYGITVERRAEMESEQGGACKICARVTTLVVDHDHSTGAVRGLLCHRCNIGIGFFADDTSILASAIQYLT